MPHKSFTLDFLKKILYNINIIYRKGIINMKVINTGHNYRIHDDSMRTFNELPSQVYNVCFDEQRGWSLQKYSDDIELKEKVYGVHTEKVNKVLNSFSQFNRNLGIILSGDKGIGKSLFSKILAQNAIAAGYPLIVVNNYIPGIASFIDSINQECIILFDEFDKTFSAFKGHDPQAEMLTLFDGVSQGKKLFVITCNSLIGLNDFLVNRPGRFHYHFRFEYPSDCEITEYMKDKLNEKYWGEIPKVVNFSKKVALNYDCLRAISFELNNGLSFTEAIKDLNIINLNAERYLITAHFTDGSVLEGRSDGESIDMFSSEKDYVYLYTDKGHNYCDLTFIPMLAKYDIDKHCLVLSGENASLLWQHSDEDIEHWSDEIKTKRADFLNWRNKKLDYVTFNRKYEKQLHYTV